MVEFQDIDNVAKEAAGNWEKFDSFGWQGSYKRDDADKWTIVYTSNRDSKLLEQSNAAVIENMLEPYCKGRGALNAADPDCVSESHGHWAVGHVDGYSIRVFNAKGEITPAFKKWVEIQNSLSDYPVLDESDYSEREYEATLENIKSIGYSLVKDDAPEGWEGEVYTYLSDNHEGSLENSDDDGGYPDKDLVEEALESLGYLESDEE